MHNVSTPDLIDLLNVSPQRINAIIKKLEIPSSEINRSGRSKLYSPFAIKTILAHRGVSFASREVMAFCNNKGGEGKTSIALNTAIRLSSLGYKVLLIDGDPQGNASSYLLQDFNYKFILHDVVNGKCGIADAVLDLSESLSVLPSGLANEQLSMELSSKRVNHRTYFSNLLGGLDYNYIIWDLSPSLSMLNYLALLSCDRINIVTTLTPFGTQGVEMTHNLIEQARSNYPDYRPFAQVLINKFDMRQTSSVRHISEIQDQVDLPLAETMIRVDSSITRSQAEFSTLKQGSNAYKDICTFVDSFTNVKSIVASPQ